MDRGAAFVRKARTAPIYRLLAFDGMKPPRPGITNSVGGEGAAIELEIWEMPAARFGDFVKLVAQPLGIGWLQLEDGSKVQGFRLVDTGADRFGASGAEAPTDITGHGGWRNYLASLSQANSEPAAKRQKAS